MAVHLESGTLLAGSYRLLHPIGEGGMGCVWVAEHVALARKVAIKVISEEVLATPIARELFQREARATAKVDSAHVVRVLDFDVTADGFPFLVLEYLVGETLEERIVRAGALTLSETTAMVDHIGHAIAAAHACGILHRDIKAENIFLVRTKDGRIDARLLDFGVAISKNTQPLMFGPVGTLQYMSPEQLLGAAVDERSDVFSLAICVYYALTAQLPFDGQSLGEIAVALQRRCLSVNEYRPELPRSLDKWFAQALARDSSERFATADEMCAAFEAALERTTPLERYTPMAHAVAIEIEDRELDAAGVPRKHAAARWLASAAMMAAVVFSATHPMWVASEAHRARAYAMSDVSVDDESESVEHGQPLRAFPREVAVTRNVASVIEHVAPSVRAQSSHVRAIVTPRIVTPSAPATSVAIAETAAPPITTQPATTETPATTDTTAFGGRE